MENEIKHSAHIREIERLIDAEIKEDERRAALKEENSNSVPTEKGASVKKNVYNAKPSLSLWRAIR